MKTKYIEGHLWSLADIDGEPLTLPQRWYPTHEQRLDIYEHDRKEDGSRILGYPVVVDEGPIK